MDHVARKESASLAATTFEASVRSTKGLLALPRRVQVHLNFMLMMVVLLFIFSILCSYSAIETFGR